MEGIPGTLSGAAESTLRRSRRQDDPESTSLCKGRDLLAVVPDARRSMYYELASRSFVSVQFDKHGGIGGRRSYSSGSWTIPGLGSKHMKAD